MNELEKNKQIESLLEEAAEQVQPNLVFKAELEDKLREAHKPRKTITWNFDKWMPTLSSITVLGALIVFMIWIFQSIEPQNSAALSEGFACPVTLPNGSVPPGITPDEDPYSYGNGELWTSLWPQGKVVMEEHNLEADGSYSMKWSYVRGVEGALTIEGRRLDAEAEPLRAFINDGYGESGLQILALIFPTTGCWEVTARVGESSLTFVTEVVYGEATPQPNVEPEIVSTPLEQNAYPWRGTTLSLNAELPEMPAEMTVYQTVADLPVTAEDARTLARRFNMDGDIYLVPGLVPGTTHYLVVDGNRQLFVQSKGIFHYVPDQSAYVKSSFFTKNANAEAVIAEFMQTYGFGTNYAVEYSNLFNGYYALPKDLNGYTLHLGYLSGNGFLFRFSEDGLIGVESSLVGYEEAGSGSIISAEEAWQKILNSTDGMGMQESMFSMSEKVIHSWARQYLLNETITVFGWLSSTGMSVDGAPPLVSLDSLPVSGNTADVAENLPNTYVEAIGQFVDDNGINKFVLDSWKVYDGFEEGIQGTITREGDSVYIAVVDGPKLLLPNFPSDVSLPTDEMYLTGVTRGDTFEWKTMDNRPFSGGGGGGGGGGFYKLNLSGTPIPFPTLEATPAPQIEVTLTPQRIEALSGMVNVTIYTESDGSQRAEYIFLSDELETDFQYMVLDGQGLEELQNFNNLPIVIWGSVDRIDESGAPVATVERFEIPYPDLEIQVWKGKIKPASTNDQNYLIFTTEDEQSYVLMYPAGPSANVDDIGMPEDTLIYIEGLTIPEDTFAGYPVIRFFGTGIVANPITGEESEYVLSANEPRVIPDNAFAPNTTISATIESVDLVYYTRDPRYATPEQLAQPQYIQPVWRFVGHYEDGNAFEILVQALTQEFLSPEPEGIFSPG